MITFLIIVFIAIAIVVIGLLIVRAALGVYIAALEAMDAREERDLW